MQQLETQVKNIETAEQHGLGRPAGASTSLCLPPEQPQTLLAYNASGFSSEHLRLLHSLASQQGAKSGRLRFLLQEPKHGAAPAVVGTAGHACWQGVRRQRVLLYAL